MRSMYASLLELHREAYRTELCAIAPDVAAIGESPMMQASSIGISPSFLG